MVSASCDPQAEEPPFTDCSWLLIQYICSYPPYLEAISSICKPRTCHATVKGTHKTWTEEKKLPKIKLH